jgi:hypothetical protein
MFKRRPASFDQEDETALLRQSIQNRGQAEIAEANHVVEQFLSEVLAAAGCSGDSEAHDWAADKLRFFMVIGWSGLFAPLETLPECSQLKAEWVGLTRDWQRSGPGYLLAWWWNLQPSLFKPVMERQLAEMRGALIDGAREDVVSSADFSTSRTDWEGLFASFE